MRRFFSCSPKGSLIHLFQKLIDTKSIIRYPEQKPIFKILRKSRKNPISVNFIFLALARFVQFPVKTFDPDP